MVAMGLGLGISRPGCAVLAFADLQSGEDTDSDKCSHLSYLLLHPPSPHPWASQGWALFVSLTSFLVLTLPCIVLMGTGHPIPCALQPLIVDKTLYASLLGTHLELQHQPPCWSSGYMRTRDPSRPPKVKTLKLDAFVHVCLLPLSLF